MARINYFIDDYFRHVVIGGLTIISLPLIFFYLIGKVSIHLYDVINKGE